LRYIGFDWVIIKINLKVFLVTLFYTWSQNKINQIIWLIGGLISAIYVCAKNIQFAASAV
jgi:hypothetical protein